MALTGSGRSQHRIRLMLLFFSSFDEVYTVGYNRLLAMESAVNRPTTSD
jgi:hypothetical protein